jgi:hypothetical protein
MMYRWLPTAEVCNIPPFAHTMVGVGAVVVNDAREILVVKEKYFTIPHWKLPGGYLEPGKWLCHLLHGLGLTLEPVLASCLFLSCIAV